MENEEKFHLFLLIYREEDHLFSACELSIKLGEIKTANTKAKILAGIVFIINF